MREHSQPAAGVARHERLRAKYVPYVDTSSPSKLNQNLMEVGMEKCKIVYETRRSVVEYRYEQMPLKSLQRLLSYSKGDWKCKTYHDATF